MDATELRKIAALAGNTLTEGNAKIITAYADMVEHQRRVIEDRDMVIAMLQGDVRRLLEQMERLQGGGDA